MEDRGRAGRKRLLLIQPRSKPWALCYLEKVLAQRWMGMARNQLAATSTIRPFCKAVTGDNTVAKGSWQFRFLLEHSIGMTLMITMMMLLTSSIQGHWLDQCMTTMIIV